MTARAGSPRSLVDPFEADDELRVLCVSFDKQIEDRDVAAYAAVLHLFRPVRLVVKNIGAVRADDVRLELEVDESSGISLKEYEPDEPARTQLGVSSSLLRDIRRQKEPGDVDVVESKGTSRIEIDCGDMQPGRRVWSEKFYVAVRESGPTTLSGQIFAATLEQPAPFAVTIDATISVADLSVEAIQEFAEKHIR